MATAAATTTTAAARPVQQNPGWWRTLFASFMLAIFLRAGFAIPFFNSFIVIGIVFLTHVLFVELGTGVENTWAGIKLTSKMLMGIVIFLALRFLAAKLLGVYPADTFGKIDDSGGLHDILFGHDISKIVLWEILFAFIGGGLALLKPKVVWQIFGVSLVVLSVQIALPKYAETWPDKDTVSTTLVDHGMVGAAVKGGWVLMFGKPSPKPAPTMQVAVASYAPASKKLVTMRERVHECHTPCNVPINFKFELDTQGDPIDLKFPGIAKPIHYSGKGTIKVPSDRGTDDVVITSSNPATTAWVKIDKVITMTQ